MGFRDLDRYPDVRASPWERSGGSRLEYGRYEFTPRTDHPLAGFVRRILPQLLGRWHPWLRAMELWLLLRELEAQVREQGGAPRSRFLSASATTNVSMVWPPGFRFEELPKAAWSGLKPSAAQRTNPIYPGPPSGALGFSHGFGSFPELANPDGYFNTQPDSGTVNFWSERYDAAFPPGEVDARVLMGVGTKDFWLPGEPVPEIVSDAVIRVDVSSKPGFGAPMPLMRARQDLSALGLPNMVPQVRALAPRALSLVQDARTQMGLRSTDPDALIDYAPTAPLRGERLELSPEEAIEVWPQLKPAEPHVLAPAPKWVREGKFKFTTRGGRTVASREAGATAAEGYAATKVLASAFTETGDFIEAVWKGVPRDGRTAGLTDSGNRRIDSMLKDLWNNWERVNWREVAANVQWNALEDALIGSAYVAIQGVVSAALRRPALGAAAALENRQWYGARSGELVGVRVNDTGDGYVVTRDSGGFIPYPDQGPPRSLGEFLSRAVGTAQALHETGPFRTERDQSQIVRYQQEARGYPRVPQAAAQNWFDYRVVDGVPWVVLRPGQSTNYRGAAPPRDPVWDARMKVKGQRQVKVKAVERRRVRRKKGETR